jgi:hypothetical protein
MHSSETPEVHRSRQTKLLDCWLEMPPQQITTIRGSPAFISEDPSRLSGEPHRARDRAADYACTYESCGMDVTTRVLSVIPSGGK